MKHRYTIKAAQQSGKRLHKDFCSRRYTLRQIFQEREAIKGGEVTKQSAPLLWALSEKARWSVDCFIEFAGIRFPVRRSQHGVCVLYSRTMEVLVSSI